ncbi:hypothetical protein [Flavobacterium rhizosphaerae]|uniref:DUF3299 domain-containing protein n=1 Tax=Flavobacterium rhizosphaerae TaxID=3163298 RepID=A0ABW8Z2K8_9FLAO
MRKVFFLVTVLFSGFLLASLASAPQHTVVVAQPVLHTAADTLSWKLLGQIQYIKKPSADYPEGVMYPLINSTLKAKNHKQVVMSGFVIPIDNKSYALSKNVFASCFFCGQAGPETIMGIKMKDSSKKFKTDQYVTLKGNFRYNDNDVDDWIYHIEDAVVVSK